ASEVAKDEVQVLFGREGCRAHDAVLSASRKPGQVCSQSWRPVNSGAVETPYRLSPTKQLVEADDRGGSNQHPASLNVKTTRPWRGIVPFTRLAREGRMTVIIGRREVLAA